jgi:hypothetical protein
MGPGLLNGFGRFWKLLDVILLTTLGQGVMIL